MLFIASSFLVFERSHLILLKIFTLILCIVQTVVVIRIAHIFDKLFTKKTLK